jgi:heptosyltransferase-2
LRRIGWIDGLPDVAHIVLQIPDAARHRATETLIEAGARPHARRLAVGAGASYGSAKCWPPDRFAKALNVFVAHQDTDIVLFGTSLESAVSETIATSLHRPPINLTGKTSIADLPALLSQCHLFLGNDSGAMHVAAAVGLPVVAVFGPTDPRGTAPVTPRATIVQQHPYCSPCFLRCCPTDHRCMTAITPAMVQAALRTQLSEVPSA